MSLSPLDGRYQKMVHDLGEKLGDQSLFTSRVEVEIQWLLHLLTIPAIQKKFPSEAKDKESIRSILQNLAEKDFLRALEIESTTQHDVKAVEYFLREKFKCAGISHLNELIHFGCTSEDINNAAYGLMVHRALGQVLVPELKKILNVLERQKKDWAAIPMMSLTHGQPASPTTVGKEWAIFHHRIKKLLESFSAIRPSIKFSGAVGNFNAHMVAFPEIPWIDVAKGFVEKTWNADFNPLTTQVENQDWIADFFHHLIRINNVFIDLSRDAWLYISREVFLLKKVDQEVGSSTMPHKVNPIHFENAEGNLELANTIATFLSDKLSKSRLQRDLSGSTVWRNIGVATGHSLLAWRMILRGLDRLEVNRTHLQKELENSYQLLSEAVMTVLRKENISEGYELMKQASRGTAWSREDYLKLISALPISMEEKEKLKCLTPSTYLGLAEKLAGF